MDKFNEQQLSMCETNELVDYIAELRVENDNLRNDIEDINKLTQFAQDKHKEYMETHSNHIKSLEKEVNKLKQKLVEKQKELITKCKIDLLKTQEIDKLKERKDDAMRLMMLSDKENDKLKKEIEKLKNPVIHNRDSRCSQFDIKVGYSYIMDCLESVLLEEEYNHFSESDYQEKADFVCEEVARTIDNAINSHIINPVGKLENHIMDKVGDKVEVLRDSGHIYQEYPGEERE
jgi:hypothetical protein